MNRPHRSRTAWPDPDTVPAPAKAAVSTTHTHRAAAPQWLVIALAVQAAWTAILTITLVLTLVYVAQVKQFRDGEQARTDARINSALCQVLAQLPAADPELQGIRRQLRCAQPGLSRDQIMRLSIGGTP